MTHAPTTPPPTRTRSTRERLLVAATIASALGIGSAARAADLAAPGSGSSAQAAEPATRGADTAVTVFLDRAQIMAYPASTTTVVVGNPIIADISLLRNTGQVILTGKGFGDTNLLFIDDSGKILQETQVRVREAPSMMVVQRGMDRETYACHPRCEPTVALGDGETFLTRSIGDIQARNSQASGAAAASASAGMSTGAGPPR